MKAMLLKALTGGRAEHSLFGLPATENRSISALLKPWRDYLFVKI
jgi:hypothetical protein